MKTKKIPRWLKVLLVIFLILFLHTFFYRFSSFTTYIPFSGRLFDIDPERVESISIISYHIKEDDHKIEITDTEQLAHLCDALNSFRYRFVLYKFMLPAMGGWDYRVVVSIKDTNEKEDMVFHDDYIEFRNIRFYATNDALEVLLEYVHGKS